LPKTLATRTIGYKILNLDACQLIHLPTSHTSPPPPPSIVTIDYDVVIIGGTITARHAALRAAQLRAQVALVEPGVSYSLIRHYAMAEICRVGMAGSDIFRAGLQLPQSWEQNISQIASTGWENITNLDKFDKSGATVSLIEYAQAVASVVEEKYSPSFLSAQGVDVIEGNPYFQADPQLAIAINGRLLKSRSYILACGSKPLVPQDIEGLENIGYYTLENVWESINQEQNQKKWVILGGTPQSIEAAQILVKLGCDVTLIVKDSCLLPEIDAEIAQILKVQLEVDGINIITRSYATQVRIIDHKKWLQVGNKAIETDEILLAIAQQPNIESLNLPAVEVKWHKNRLLVNDKLQTTNRRIFASGDVIGGYEFINIANYEAKIALSNALFFSTQKTNYKSIPWVVATQPFFATVGFNEAMAKKRYGENAVIVLRQYVKNLTTAQFTGETTGLCKFIILSSGQILGASILGAQAREIINLVAIAIDNDINIQKISHLIPAYPSFSEIIEQIGMLWHQQQLNTNRQEFLEDFFAFRRDWKI
jgi:pyruvate/2-oxoglutarate dehydrogenase complex dihydrolipoamide dehydrogenase (E3) component